MDLSSDPQEIVPPDTSLPEEEVWQALVLGTRDYVRKCGFERVLLGLSGGIDSSSDSRNRCGGPGSRQRAGRADALTLHQPRQH